MNHTIAITVTITMLMCSAHSAQPSPESLMFDESTVRELFNGENPGNWPAEKVYQTYIEIFLSDVEVQCRQSSYLNHLMYRDPKPYAELAAKSLAASTNLRELGVAAEYVRRHRDPESARNSVILSLKRTDIALPRTIVEIAAGTLERVGHPEDAYAILPYLQQVAVDDRRNLWQSLVRFAGPEFVDLLEADIAAIESIIRSGEASRSRETFLRQTATGLGIFKRQFEGRLATTQGMSMPGSSVQDGGQHAQSTSKIPPSSGNSPAPIEAPPKAANPQWVLILGGMISAAVLMLLVARRHRNRAR